MRTQSAAEVMEWVLAVALVAEGAAEVVAICITPLVCRVGCALADMLLRCPFRTKLLRLMHLRRMQRLLKSSLIVFSVESARSNTQTHIKSNDMKIAVTTTGNDLNSQLDQRFGRAKNFIVYDIETNKFEVFDNEQNLNAAQGAGIQSAERVVRLGAGALISGNCGPKAFRVLKAAGVKIYNTDAPTVADAIKLYREGKLSEAQDANVEGHWV